MKMFAFSFVTVLIFVLVNVAAGSISSHLNRQKRSSDYNCQCATYSCGCCAHLDVPQIGLNDTACVNLAYLPKDYGISFVMTIDNLTIYNETISARNPPPICFGAPMLKDYAEVCIHFVDLNVSTTKLHGCVQLEARLRKIVIGRYPLGCFNIGNTKFSDFIINNAEFEKLLKTNILMNGGLNFNSVYVKVNEADKKFMQLLHLVKKNLG